MQDVRISSWKGIMQLLSANANENEKVKSRNGVQKVLQLWLHSVTLSLVLNQHQKHAATRAAENTFKKRK